MKPSEITSSGDATESEAPPVALVTGSGRHRVGNVIARYLAERQYEIALHFNSSEAEALATRDAIRKTGVRCEAFQGDVSDEAEVLRLVNSVHQTFGRIDVLVTTASIWSPGRLSEVTADDLRRNFDVNTLGTFLVARSVGSLMVKQPQGGAIVTIGDWAIDRPYLHHAAYLISKGAIPTLTRTLALELGNLNPNVRVNCIHPGPVMFPPNTSEQERQQLIDSTVVKNGDCPEMVAHAVKFLVDNRFITGACIPIDGGRHMYSPSDLERGQ